MKKKPPFRLAQGHTDPAPRAWTPSDYDDPISDAMNLYLDLLNFFVNLLRILGAAKK